MNRKPLTEEDIKEIATSLNDGNFNMDDVSAYDWLTFVQLIRMVEDKHGIK